MPDGRVLLWERQAQQALLTLLPDQATYTAWWQALREALPAHETLIYTLEELEIGAEVPAFIHLSPPADRQRRQRRWFVLEKQVTKTRDARHIDVALLCEDRSGVWQHDLWEPADTLPYPRIAVHASKGSFTSCSHLFTTPMEYPFAGRGTWATSYPVLDHPARRAEGEEEPDAISY